MAKDTVQTDAVFANAQSSHEEKPKNVSGSRDFKLNNFAGTCLSVPGYLHFFYLPLCR